MPPERAQREIEFREADVGKTRARAGARFSGSFVPLGVWRMGPQGPREVAAGRTSVSLVLKPLPADTPLGCNRLQRGGEPPPLGQIQTPILHTME